MHILYLLTAPGIPLGGPSGSARHVDAVIQALVALGHRVSLCVARRIDGLYPDPPARLLEVSPAPTFWPRDRVSSERHHSLELADRAADWLRDDPPDLIYERYSLFSEAGSRLRERFQVPWVLEVNAPLRLERAWYEGFRADGRARRAEKRTLARADRLLVVSNPLAEYLVRTVGVAASRVEVVPNGVDLSRFRPRPRSLELARRLGLGAGPVVGFAGSLKPWHGLDRWLEVLVRVRERIPGVQGLVIGEGPEGAGLRARVVQAGLEPFVRFTGQLETGGVAEHLGLMDLLLAPYPRIEPFYFCPLKVLEALAAGVPVVTTAQGDLPELVGEAGAVVPPDDLEALVEGVAVGISRPEVRQRWVGAAPGQVTGRDWSDVAKRIVG